jgi:CheY-like chemotaxis protein
MENAGGSEVSEDSPIVLAIDDEKLMLQMIIDGLRSFGIAGVWAANDKEGLRIVENTPSLQLLLADINLGRTTGPDVIRHALRMRPDLKVVFMTGASNTVPFRRTDPLLLKPFTLAQLRSTIEATLSGPARPVSPPWPSAAERRRQNFT